MTAASGATGVRSTTATVAVVADVHVSGRVAGRAFTDTFSPKFSFQLDPLVMKLTERAVRQEHGLDQRGSDVTPAGARWRRTRSRTIAARRSASSGSSVDAMIARWATLGGAVLSALVLLIVSRCFARCVATRSRCIDARDGHMIVPVAASEPGTQRVATIDVTSMSDLVRLAERYDRLILHQARDGAHVYLFEADGIIYRYSIRDVDQRCGGRPSPAHLT